MSLIKFKNNRVRRKYYGGQELDRLQNTHPITDSDRPEEWIASLVEAINDNLTTIENEGISITDDELTFVEWLKKDPKKLLGAQHYSEYGISLGFLVKLIDSSMRLNTQVHPTRKFSKERLDSDWGKFEAYYVLKIRDNDDGYIRLGFQNAPTRDEWRDIIAKQDIERMDNCFEKIPIEQGDIIYIPGGMPHAIGENILLVEIMEPSDLIVRCEFEREGFNVSEEARYMGKDIEFGLDVFDYTELSVAEVKNRFFLEKEKIIEEDGFTIDLLVPASIAPTFQVYSFKVDKAYELALDERFLVGVNLDCQVEISSDDETITLEPGESFFVSSTTKRIKLESLSNETAELCVITNVL